MIKNILEARLANYKLETQEDEQDALKEILQETILYALSSANFFNQASFCGGTSLRILHNLARFSEDLDFMLLKSDVNFNWQPFLSAINSTCKEFGIEPEVIDKSELGKSVQMMFLKDNSIGKMLQLQFHHHPSKKLRIKLEIDTNPPLGALTEIKYINFPLDCSIATLDLPSNFAGKCHALLCRKYIKGRDWYDFIWYVNNKVKPNFTFLSSALDQQGPWENQSVQVDKDWLIQAFREKIASIDWHRATQDVAPFIRTFDKRTLNLWGENYFIEKLGLLSKNCEEENTVQPRFGSWNRSESD